MKGLGGIEEFGMSEHIKVFMKGNSSQWIVLVGGENQMKLFFIES